MSLLIRRLFLGSLGCVALLLSSPLSQAGEVSVQRCASDWYVSPASQTCSVPAVTVVGSRKLCEFVTYCSTRAFDRITGIQVTLGRVPRSHNCNGRLTNGGCPQ